MPEAPDLEVIKDYLNRRVRGRTIASAEVLRPSVVRSMTGEDLALSLPGRSLDRFTRRGKFMQIRLSTDRVLVVNPMLTGVFRHCASSERVARRTCVRLTLDDGQDLRYIDDKQMGMVYLTSREGLNEVPRLADQGPDVLEALPPDEFSQRLKPFHGEIKGILTRGRFISGIGNAYADEILFDARIYPFKRRKALSSEELERLRLSCPSVTVRAMKTLRERIGDRIHLKVRDFLSVHNKGGKPCPRCGEPIRQISANRRITSFCRTCQPGLLIRN